MVKNIDKKLRNEFTNKIILISGGTGSIGLGLIKQLTKHKPKEIRILSNDENSVAETVANLGQSRIYKLNPFDAVKTNVVGTSNLLEASIIEEVKKFIFISTDKATNPTSTLGGSKLLAERLTLDASTYVGQGKTKFAIVRFGNVLGSRGSVFQIFQNQIKLKKPLDVTDKRMTRFIMSISEASSMILRVTRIMKDGEIYILKMPSIRIQDLAEGMLHVYESRFPIYKNTSYVKISKIRERERFHEFLITSEELPFCHDIGGMYKISKIENKKPLTINKFSSETASRITKSELYKSINELIDEYVSY